MTSFKGKYKQAKDLVYNLFIFFLSKWDTILIQAYNNSF